MVQKSLNASMGTTFGGSNVVPRNQVVVVWHCKKTLNIISKPKSFQKKTSHGIHVLCYVGYWFTTKGVSIELYKFWFCHNDLLRCMGRTSRKYAFDRPILLSLWLVQTWTNFI
jgi:hypothetical protein